MPAGRGGGGEGVQSWVRSLREVCASTRDEPEAGETWIDPITRTTARTMAWCDGSLVAAWTTHRLALPVPRSTSLSFLSFQLPRLLHRGIFEFITHHLHRTAYTSTRHSSPSTLAPRRPHSGHTSTSTLHTPALSLPPDYCKKCRRPTYTTPSSEKLVLASTSSLDPRTHLRSTR